MCRQLDIGEDELRAYVPMAETIGSIYTLLYYCRRSYEEGLAAFGYARERVAGLSGYAPTIYNGLAKHYGVKARNMEVHAYAEPEHGDKALELFRKVVITADLQRRCRRASSTRSDQRVRALAMNRWLEEKATPPVPATVGDVAASAVATGVTRRPPPAGTDLAGERVVREARDGPRSPVADATRPRRSTTPT